MKTIFKAISYVILTIVIMFGIFLGYITLVDYKPVPIEQLSAATGNIIDVSDTLKVFDWNIGYCGLGDDMSFFYDGGEKVRTSKQRTQENVVGVLNEIKQHSDFDFFLFQEVDLNSRRSFRINEMLEISSVLKNYFPQMALNYKVAFVPVPLSNPMGKVKGGIATFSKFEPFKVTRYSFFGNFDWPKGLFMLDRCFMVHRFKTSDGKELLIVNTHNEAFDAGELRKKQMDMLKEFLIDEYNKGNFIMAGGDWNQNPPIPGKESEKSTEGKLTRIRIASDFMPAGWQWVYSDSVPTNRMVDEAYNPVTTGTTVIDFFLLSPNLQPINLRNIDQKFINSDHNPVIMSFGFIKE